MNYFAKSSSLKLFSIPTQSSQLPEKVAPPVTSLQLAPCLTSLIWSAIGRGAEMAVFRGGRGKIIKILFGCQKRGPGASRDDSDQKADQVLKPREKEGRDTDLIVFCGLVITRVVFGDGELWDFVGVTEAGLQPFRGWLGRSAHFVEDSVTSAAS